MQTTWFWTKCLLSIWKRRGSSGTRRVTTSGSYEYAQLRAHRLPPQLKKDEPTEEELREGVDDLASAIIMKTDVHGAKPVRALELYGTTELESSSRKCA